LSLRSAHNIRACCADRIQKLIDHDPQLRLPYSRVLGDGLFEL